MSKDETWMALPMPTPAEIVDACSWLETQPDAIDVRERPGYWIEVDDAEVNDRYSSDDFCWKHASALAKRLRAKGHEDVTISTMDHGETDIGRYCSEKSCGKQLAAGGLTDDGIDDAIAIGEEDPTRSGTGAYDLMRASWNMSNDDERYRLWMLHVDDLRADEAARTRKTP